MGRTLTKSMGRTNTIITTTTQRFRSEDKIKVDHIIKDCHFFCKDNFRSITQLKIDREAQEIRNSKFTNIS